MMRLHLVLMFSRLLGLHAYVAGMGTCLNVVVERWEDL
jgi:hypothetical protein